MYKNILVAVAPDHQQLLTKQLEFANRLKAEGGKISAVSVIESFPAHVAEYVVVQPRNDDLLSGAKTSLDHLLSKSPEIDRTILSGKPGVVLAEHAGDIGADLIVLGSSRPGSSGYALGSTASRVSRRAPCSVVIVR